MKRRSAKKKDVLLRQKVSRGKRRGLFFPGLRAFGSFCKGCMKVFGAVLVLGLISFSFLSVYHYILTSPYLRLDQVVVKGVGKDLKTQLLKMADLGPRTSLLALNLGALKKRLEQDPWIRSVEVERRFPHTLIIRAERQEPRAILLADGMYYLNRFGEVFKKVDLSEDTDFPLVTGLRLKGKGAGDALRQVARLMDKLQGEKRPWSLADLSEIHIDDGTYFTLYFEHVNAGIRVTEEALQAEVQKLRRVVADLVSNGRIGDVRTIDLCYRDGVVVSFRKG